MSNNIARPLKKKESFAYCLGDLGNNMVYQFVSIYLLIFYTDVLGISPAAAGTLFLIARIWDAVNDPIMGMIADKTNTRWGRFRPYLGFMAIPLAVITVVMFTAPTGLSESAKLIYAYVSYIGFGMIYTAGNVPYISMLSVLSPSAEVRTKIVATRSLLSMTAIFAMASVPALVASIGQGNDAKGYSIVSMIFGAIAALLWLTTFFFSEEKIDLTTKSKEKPAEKLSPKSFIAYMRVNKPLQVLCLVFLTIFALMTIQTSAGIYIFKYLLKEEAMFSAFMITQLVGSIIGIVAVRFLVDRFERKAIFLFGLLLSMIKAPVILTMNIDIILVVGVIGAIGGGLNAGLIWGFVPDAVEFGELKTGLRMDGLSSAMVGFFFKFGMALGGIIPGFMLEYYDYVPNLLEQPERSLTGLTHLGVTIPIIITSISVVVMAMYPLDRKKQAEISAALIKSRDQQAGTEELSPSPAT